MNKAVKVKSMNKAVRMKELFLKLWFGTYLMATLKIKKGKRYSKNAEVSLDWTITIIKGVLLGLVSK